MEIFKNYIETFENIRKYSKDFQVYALLIEILLRWPRGFFISQKLPKLTEVCYYHIGSLQQYWERLFSRW